MKRKTDKGVSKILVANPPGRHFVRARGDNWPSTSSEDNVIYTSFPYLLATAAALLEREGHEVCLVDCVAEGMERNKFVDVVNSFEPALIVMLTATPSYYCDVETRRSLGPEVPVVAVGVHASATPERHLMDGFDFVIRGEFEYALVDLMSSMGTHDRMKEIKGLCFHRDKGFHISGFSEPVPNLDDMPFPAYHLLNMDLYSEPFAKGRNIMLMSSRGCPYCCDYCCVPYFYSHSIYRKRSPKLVVDEIEQLLKRYKLDEIYFDDSSITVDKDHLLSLALEIKSRDLRISWSCMGNVNVSDEVLEILADSRCRGLKIGIETGNIEVLGQISKRITKSDIVRVVRKCQNLGMKVHGTYMIGLPGETAKEAQETIDFMLELSTNTAQIAIATPFPGTRFYEQAKENGWMVTEDWSLFDGSHAILSYPNFSSEEIQKIFARATRRWERHIIFSRPSTVLHHLYGVYTRRGAIGVIKGIRYGMNTIFRRI